ncbi:thermostable hemolysin [Thalassomonas viridans]|uniref:Thermostable hemolysin n=1 Tax=Thalassomonas viridans TaxID=137584 RepID=A0AAE9Z6K9_9GAMM|nr:thermostable hemolysin [Thalassomonas viridans]WDE07675.1 thermostable hemolysin [Thalassomonas viridans]
MLNITPAVTTKANDPRKESTGLPFTAELITRTSSERNRVERFISEGFKRAFDAQIDNFLPAIITIKNRGDIKAALGIRSARTPLFIEQYTKTPVQELAYFKQKMVKRPNIAEIGNLYSSSSRFTISLFLTMGVALYLNGYSHLVFAGTKQVIELLSSTGSKTHFLCHADKGALDDEQSSWGSYYQAKPQVVAVDLLQIMCVINNNAKYSAMFNQQTPQIAALKAQMLERL